MKRNQQKALTGMKKLGKPFSEPTSTSIQYVCPKKLIGTWEQINIEWGIRFYVLKNVESTEQDINEIFNEWLSNSHSVFWDECMTYALDKHNAVLNAPEEDAVKDIYDRKTGKIAYSKVFKFALTAKNLVKPKTSEGKRALLDKVYNWLGLPKAGRNYTV